MSDDPELVALVLHHISTQNNGDTVLRLLFPVTVVTGKDKASVRYCLGEEARFANIKDISGVISVNQLLQLLFPVFRLLNLARMPCSPLKLPSQPSEVLKSSIPSSIASTKSSAFRVGPVMERPRSLARRRNSSTSLPDPYAWAVAPASN